LKRWIIGGTPEIERHVQIELILLFLTVEMKKRKFLSRCAHLFRFDEWHNPVEKFVSLNYYRNISFKIIVSI
jgi:hypothetical protein